MGRTHVRSASEGGWARDMAESSSCWASLSISARVVLGLNSENLMAGSLQDEGGRHAPLSSDAVTGGGYRRALQPTALLCGRHSR
jgi:hypothetical protein